LAEALSPYGCIASLASTPLIASPACLGESPAEPVGVAAVRGAGWEQVAASLEITEEAARKRWQRLLEKFKRERLDG